MHVIRDIEGDFGLQVLLLLLENNDWNVPNLCRQLKLNNRGKLYSMFQSIDSLLKSLTSRSREPVEIITLQTIITISFALKTLHSAEG